MCFLTAAKKKIPICKFLDHLEELNPAHTNLLRPLSANLGEKASTNRGCVSLIRNFEGTCFQRVYSREWKKVVYLKLGDSHHFLFQCWVSNFYATCFFACQYVGLPKDASKYSFCLKLLKGSSEKEIIVTGPVLTIDTDYFSMTRDPNLFKISFDDIKDYCSQDHLLNLAWEVSIVEHPSKGQMSVCEKAKGTE